MDSMIGLSEPDGILSFLVLAVDWMDNIEFYLERIEMQQ